jgi:Family of unknown function (DUF6297)
VSKKSKKLIRAGGQPPEAAPTASAPHVATGDAENPYAAFAGRDWGFHFLPDATPHPVDEKALHRLMKDWRHGRASKTIGQVLGDAYFMLFSLGVIGAMVVNLLLNSSHAAASCTSEGCLTGRSLLPWAVLFAAGTAALAASRTLGPVLASAAEGFWLMDAPTSRTRLLGGRLVGVVLAAFGIGAVVGTLLALLSGSAPLVIASWGLATGATASALIALAALEQTFERRVLLRALQTLFALSAVVVVAWMVLIAAGRAALVTVSVATMPWVIAAAGGVLTVVFSLLAYGRLNEIRRARLLSGGSLVSGMQGAMFALDLGLARDILVEREAVARGHVRPTKGRGVGVRALVWRDAQRLIRFPKPFLGLVATALVPYAADALGLTFVMPFLAALALVAALVPFFGSLRVLSRTGGLARAFPFSTRELRNATMIVPTVLAVVWMAVVAPAVFGVAGGPTRSPTDALMTTVAIGLAGLLGAVRWQTAKQTDFNTPMMATNAGAMPPSLIFNLFRGIDVCAAITGPLMLGAPIWVSLGIAAVIYFLLGMNMGDLQEEAKEEKRKADEAKAAAEKTSGEKIKIARPQR